MLAAACDAVVTLAGGESCPVIGGTMNFGPEDLEIEE